MNKNVQAKWTARLRSLDPELQGTKALKQVNGKMCCLGVLCEIAVEEGILPPPVKHDWNYVYMGDEMVPVYEYGEDNRTGILPREVADWAELEREPGTTTACNPVLKSSAGAAYTAADWNDDHKKSFKEIADMIDRL